MSKRKVCHACVSLPRDSLCGICDDPAEDVRAACRNDHRCQQAIEYGVEGIAHCPEGKCAMPDVRAVGDEPVAWIKPKTLESLTPSGMVYVTGFDIGGSIPLYRHPQRPDTLNAVLQWILGPGREEDPMTFLRCWTEGKFDLCREEWPQAPKECYP